MDVGAWLRGLGLGQYEQAFRDNDVDAGLLPTLTADDLRELGVASLGHRKRLLAAIAALSPSAPIASVPLPASAGPRAERRQLTVMFVDLVGSTALSARLDPEEMGKVLRAYQDAVAGEVLRWEGHVAKFMGDGVLAYFGWPRAHEDEAERAVRAGLEIAGAVRGARDAGGGDAGGPDRDRDRARGGGRARRRGCRPRGGGGRRDPEPGRAAARHRSRGRGCRRRGDPASARWLIRARGPRRAAAEGHRRAGPLPSGCWARTRSRTGSRPDRRGAPCRWWAASTSWRS